MILMAGAAALSAQQAGQWTAGARLGAAFGFNDSMDMGNDFDEPGHFVSDEMLVNFNIAVYGAYAFTDRISVQAELNFMINQGYTKRVVYEDVVERLTEVTYSSVDIPILLRFNFLNSPSAFGILAGPHISIPLGRAQIIIDGTIEQVEIDSSATFGITAGLFGGVRLGPGRIMGDLRFIFDFNSSEERQMEESLAFMRRRALLFTLGYEISF